MRRPAARRRRSPPSADRASPPFGAPRAHDVRPYASKIALAQANPIVGDIDGKSPSCARCARAPAALGADLVVFPELFSPAIRRKTSCSSRRFRRLRARARGAGAELGPRPGGLTGTCGLEDGHVYNAVVLIDDGKVEAVRFKVDLPNYGVFDEKRVFAPGPLPGPIDFRGVRLGVPICEDIWGPDVVECLAEMRRRDPHLAQRLAVRLDKPDVRMNIAVARVIESGLPLVYVNQVGGQDELVFDGASFVLNADKSLAVQLPAWEEALALTEWRKTESGWRCEPGERCRDRAGRRAPPIRRACSACATTSRRTAFPASCSASPAASTARSSPPSPSTRWARSACTPS